MKIIAANSRASYDYLLNYKIAVRTIPDISNIARGKSFITEFVDLEIDDLLGRIPVEPFQSLMKKNIFSKTILVTGAGGSIGSELCRQIIRNSPSKLILLDNSEFNLYSINQELQNNLNDQIELIIIFYFYAIFLGCIFMHLWRFGLSDGGWFVYLRPIDI